MVVSSPAPRRRYCCRREGRYGNAPGGGLAPSSKTLFHFRDTKGERCPAASDFTREDCRALIEGVADGTVDAIVTDHAPHCAFEKDREFERAPFGMTGLETSLGLIVTNLVKPGIIGWNRLVELMAVNPRRIIRAERVSLEPGSVADFTVIDPDAAWTVSADDFESKAANSAFIGTELVGRATDVYVGGYATMEEGAIVE